MLPAVPLVVPEVPLALPLPLGELPIRAFFRTNLSLALLCGVAVVKLYDLPWSSAVVRVVAAACFTTVVINVIRISSIGLLPGYYDLIHGPVGVAASEWTTNLAVAAIFARGLQLHVPAHA